MYMYLYIDDANVCILILLYEITWYLKIAYPETLTPFKSITVQLETLVSIKFGKSVIRMHWRIFNLAICIV